MSEAERVAVDQLIAEIRGSAQEAGACIVAAMPSGDDGLTFRLPPSDMVRIIREVKPRIVYLDAVNFDLDDAFAEGLELDGEKAGSSGPATTAAHASDTQKRRQ